jgi:hypothetical protein
VEQNECRILGKCDECFKEAHEVMMKAKKIDSGILDAGGVAMMRDGLMAEMTRAKLESLERMREVRLAREGVLEAQREAEWATEERHTSAGKLIESRQALKGERLEVTRWKLQNEKKLKKMRARAREQRLERQKAERKLEAAKRKYSKAKQRFRVASTNTTANAANESIDEEDVQDEDSLQEGEEVWKLAKEVERRQEAVERAEKDVERTSADGEWLDRGLRRRVKGAQSGARKSREDLLESRARERVSRQRLEEAKEHYVRAVNAAKFADKAAQEAEQKLRKAPMSPYSTSQGLAAPVQNNSTPSLRGKAASNLPGFTCAFAVLLTLTAMRVA